MWEARIEYLSYSNCRNHWHGNGAQMLFQIWTTKIYWRLGFLIFGFYCTSKNLLVKESLLVKVRQQVKKDLVKNVVMYNEAGLIKLWASQNNCANEAFLLNPSKKLRLHSLFWGLQSYNVVNLFKSDDSSLWVHDLSLICPQNRFTSKILFYCSTQ